MAGLLDMLLGKNKESAKEYGGTNRQAQIDAQVNSRLARPVPAVPTPAPAVQPGLSNNDIMSVLNRLAAEKKARAAAQAQPPQPILQ